MGETLLKITDAAQRLSVSRYWIYRRIESGELPVVELSVVRGESRPDPPFYMTRPHVHRRPEAQAPSPTA